MKKCGFTLVELSIVLVIVGLLIGGILVGQSLIESANMQRAIRDLNQYSAAMNSFTTKFKQLPGDSGLFTPGGNNNRIVDNPLIGYDDQCNGIYSPEESHQVFAHLTQSAMLQKTYEPYQTHYCGGTHSDTFNSTSNGDLVIPTINISDRKIVLDIYGEGPFLNLGQIHLYIRSLRPAEVLALENKLGSDAYNSRGVGRCRRNTPPFTAVNCSASNARDGDIYYVIKLK